MARQFKSVNNKKNCCEKLYGNPPWHFTTFSVRLIPKLFPFVLLDTEFDWFIIKSELSARSYSVDFEKKNNSECTKLRSGVELSEGLAYLGVIENQLRGPLKPLVCVYITQTRRIIALITLPAGCAAAYYRISIKRYQLSQDHFSAQSRKRKGVEKTIFGLNKKNSTPWAPQYTIVLWWSERLQGALNWAPMMPKDASLW